MNKIKNISLWFMFLSFTSFASACFSESFSLTNCVIKHEARIKYIREDIERLWHVCYEYVKVNDGMVKRKVNGNTSYYENTYRNELRRRPSCLDSDVIAHKERSQDLCKAIQEAIIEIRTITHRNDMVSMVDYTGKTALNYCYTREIYDELIRQGVPFQWKVWVYFNPQLAMLSATGVVVGTVLVGTGLHTIIYR